MKSIRTRGRTFTGTVINTRMQSTATVEWSRRKYIPKYERYERSRTRIKVHNPEEINAQEGDIVKIVECRPISKTKKFIIIEKLGHERLFEAKQELLEESKVKQESKSETEEEQ